MHGDKRQEERDRVLGLFRSGHCPILIATDVASRGLGMYQHRRDHSNHSNPGNHSNHSNHCEQRAVR